MCRAHFEGPFADAPVADDDDDDDDAETSVASDAAARALRTAAWNQAPSGASAARRRWSQVRAWSVVPWACWLAPAQTRWRKSSAPLPRLARAAAENRPTSELLRARARTRAGAKAFVESFFFGGILEVQCDI